MITHLIFADAAEPSDRVACPHANLHIVHTERPGWPPGPRWGVNWTWDYDKMCICISAVVCFRFLCLKLWLIWSFSKLLASNTWRYSACGRFGISRRKFQIAMGTIRSQRLCCAYKGFVVLPEARKWKYKELMDEFHFCKRDPFLSQSQSSHKCYCFPSGFKWTIMIRRRLINEYFSRSC